MVLASLMESTDLISPLQCGRWVGRGLNERTMLSASAFIPGELPNLCLSCAFSEVSQFSFSLLCFTLVYSELLPFCWSLEQVTLHGPFRRSTSTSIIPLS